MFVMNNKVVRIIEGSVLFLLLVFSYCFEQIPRANGMGWDGIIYGGMMQNFLFQFQGDGYSAYYIQKSLPFALINVFDTLFHVSDGYFTLIVFETLSLALAVVAFYKTSTYLKLSKDAEIIAFALLFFTHFILRIGYSPYKGDPFAFSIGIWIFYFFVSRQLWKMLFLSIIGAFVWQSIWPISLVLFVLPQQGFNIVDGKHVSQRYGKILSLIKIALSVGLLAIPFKMFLLAEKRYGSYLYFSDVVPYFYFEISIWTCMVSTICICVLFYLAIRPLSFNVKEFVMHVLKNARWQYLVIAVLLYFVMRNVIGLLSNSDSQGSFFSISFLRRLLFEPFTIPLKFFASHVANEGIMVCFLILLYKPILEFVSEHSVGYIIVFVMSLFFGTQTESRFILNLFPFVAFPIAVVISRINLKKWVPYLVCVLQLTISMFWYKTNTPSLAQALEVENDVEYTVSEAQRVLYYSGPWMGKRAYVLFLMVFIVVMTCMFLGKKYSWFTKS